MTEKYLIIHADDFGLSPGINEGILTAIRQGVVTSTSVIIRTKYRNHTQKLIAQNADVDWGLHVVINRQGTPHHQFISRETDRQIQTFYKIFKFLPSHIDFHKGFRFTSRTYFAVRMLVLKYRIAFRYDNRHRIETGFYGLVHNTIAPRNVSTESFISILKSIKPGFTELVCHPGNTGNRLGDPYRTPRNTEVVTLTSYQARQAIRQLNIQTITFREYSRLTATTSQ